MEGIKKVKLINNLDEKVKRKAELRFEVYKFLDTFTEIARRGEKTASLKRIADYLAIPEVNMAVKDRDDNNMLAWVKLCISD